MISPTRFTTVITAVKAQIDTVCLFVFRTQLIRTKIGDSRKNKTLIQEKETINFYNFSRSTRLCAKNLF